MTFLSISLLVFSITILITIILFVIWWKKYGKDLFLMFKNLKNIKNTLINTKNNKNQQYIDKFYNKLGNFGGKIGNINQKMYEFTKKITKK